MCPLCDSGVFEVRGTLPLDVCLRAMGIASATREDIEKYVESDVPPSCTTDLRRCSCGLDYFSPQVVGGPALYEELAQRDYYQPLRWDHERAIKLLDVGQFVLDLGCGDGAFVRAAAEHAEFVVGVDFSIDGVVGPSNTSFVRARADLGGESLHEVSRLVTEPHVVTAFQVVEHLADPVRFVSRAADLIQPGGRILVSVPNRNRFEIDARQPLDCAPHHQTRWDARLLEVLGDRAGLATERVIAQRTRNPIKVANRIVRRTLARRDKSWPLPASARPWPLSNIGNGMSLLAVYSKAA